MVDREELKEGDIIHYCKWVMLIDKIDNRWEVKYRYDTRSSQDLRVLPVRLSMLNNVTIASEGQIKHLHSLMVRNGHATHEELKSWIWIKNNHKSTHYSIF